MTLIQLYQSHRAENDRGENSRALLKQTHWLTVNVDFDPKTGEALSQALSAFLARVAQMQQPARRLHDRLWRITEHARPSVERLFRALSESPRREHALLPVRAVRELDANSFIKLSNRPGRTIREKLAGKPYLQAVRRFQSVNLPENRLLKAFVTRLAELLQLRQDCLGEQEDELLPKIESWLLSDKAQAIDRWDNLPPNNTLLSDRDYRRIWDAWRWLQTLDDDVTRDFAQLAPREETMRHWNEYGRLYREGTHRFADMPLLFDYETFAIQPWVSQLSIRKATSPLPRFRRTSEMRDAACIDLTVIRPRYASGKASTGALRETFLWQEWKNDSKCVDITLFTSDAAYLHPDATSIASPDLFFSRHDYPDILDRAARAFAATLRDTFRHDTLIWLVPDSLNDFELEIIRRNLNARFPNAEPLPRSVAAAFERVDHSKIRNDGYSIVVVDAIGGTTCVTKLIARFDPELRKHLPETNGYYWERCPPVIITRQNTGVAAGNDRADLDMMTVDAMGQWRDSSRGQVPQLIEESSLKHDSRIGQFAFCINLTNSPVAGGAHLYALQQRAGGIPLWGDQIPSLSIKVRKRKDWCYSRFYHLVSRGTTVRPIRGQSVSIPVQENFTLPAGNALAFYQFPLFQGENAGELGFSARLDSPAFPLKQDAECTLNLTFEYGADEPYSLTFTPLNKSFPPVRATWRRTEILTDAPAPKCPTPMSWTDLRSVPKPGGNDTSDMLKWFLSAIDKLDIDLFILPRRRTVGQVSSCWHASKNGDHYTFATCDDTDTNVSIHQNDFVDGLSYEDFEEGDQLSFELQRHGSNCRGRNVAGPNHKEEASLRNLEGEALGALVTSMRRRLYVPIIQIWTDGRSLTDTQCPKGFAKAAEEKIAYLSHLVNLKELPQPVKNELFFLLACLHKDTTKECIQWIADQVGSARPDDPQAVGFALGDVSEPWQKAIFNSLASRPNSAVISVFSYAIWREQQFVDKLSPSVLQSLLNCLSQRLSNIRPQDKWANRKWVRTTAEPLELLLGLLRTRASTDPEIKMILQPQQNITKALAEQIDRVEEMIAESNINLFSRVQINIAKPDGVRTPNLLYALRLYLTGENGANAIHITSIADTDDD